MNNAVFFYVDGIPTKGLWVDMDAIDDMDEVKEALAEGGFIPCNAEGDPNYDGDILAADAQGLCAPFTGKCGTFNLRDFTDCRDYCDSNKVDYDAAIAYMDYALSWNRSDFADAFEGPASSEEAFAKQLADDCGMLDSMPENLRMYFDYAAYARDLFISNYWMQDGYVFRRI